MDKDYEFKKMLASGMINNTIKSFKDDNDSNIVNYIEKLSKNIEILCESDMFSNEETFERFQSICLLKQDINMYDVVMNMFDYNIFYVDKYNGGDDFINNVLEYAIQVKDLDFLKNNCFQFIIDMLFPNKIYDRIRATLICMGKDINEVDELYNCIKKVED